MAKQQTDASQMTRELTDTEKLLISRIAAMLPDEARRQQLLMDMANATAEVMETKGATRIIFHIKGYERPPYRGQHSFGVEGKLFDKDDMPLMLNLYADENDRLLELELIRQGPGSIKGPIWDALVLY